MYRVTLHFIKATKPNFGNVSASIQKRKMLAGFFFLIKFYFIFCIILFSFPCLCTSGKRQTLIFPIFFIQTPQYAFFSTSALFSIQSILSNAALSLQSCKTVCLQIKIFILLAFLLLAISAAYPVNLFFPFTPECQGSFCYFYVCLLGLSSAISCSSFYSHSVRAIKGFRKKLIFSVRLFPIC